MPIQQKIKKEKRKIMNTQIKNICSELKLLTLAAAAERRAAQAIADNLSHLEFLHLLLEDEKLERKNKTACHLIKKAKFRTNSSLDDWDQSFDRGLNKQKLKDLSLLSFYYSNQNLIVLGRTGEGKTHLAISLGRKLCLENISTAFVPVNFLFEEMLAAKAAGKYLSAIRSLNQKKVLILDDFGLRNYTHEEANMLVDLLEDRTKKGIVIITSQIDPNGWSKLFEDPVISEAVTDRLKNPSQQLELKGGSYREKLKTKSS
jgi:DNA replication protein DnaC